MNYVALFPIFWGPEHKLNYYKITSVWKNKPYMCCLIILTRVFVSA